MNQVSIESLARLYESEYARFLRVAEAICGDRSAARDAVQDGFATALAHRREFRGDGAPESWVWSCVVNAARQVRRRERGDPRLANAEPSAEGEDVAEWLGVRAVVGAVLRELPERQRLALFLRHYADLDYRAIGAVLGTRPGTVAATLHQARAAIRERLGEAVR